MAKVPPRQTPTALKPGVYLAEIKNAVQKTSKATGDAYLALHLVAVDFGGAFLCFDNAMLEGGGANIGSAKLSAFDLDPGDNFEPNELIGRRVYVDCVLDTYEGVDRLKVAISRRDSRCGYWPEADGPADVTHPTDANAWPPETEGVPPGEEF